MRSSRPRGTTSCGSRSSPSGRVFRGTTELREALAALAAQGIRYEPELHDLEQHGNVVARPRRPARVAQRDVRARRRVHWAYHFRDGRLRRQTTHASREEALETLAALRLLDDATFSLAEERRQRRRAHHPAARRARHRLGARPRARPAALAPGRAARGRSTSPASSSWTRPACACSCARGWPPNEGRWEIFAAQRAADHPAPVRHDRRARRRCRPRRPEPAGYTSSPAVGVAQLVELLVVVQVVAGSSPVAHPSRKPC